VKSYRYGVIAPPRPRVAKADDMCQRICGESHDRLRLGRTLNALSRSLVSGMDCIHDRDDPAEWYFC
jgi:hypothetical protein